MQSIVRPLFSDDAIGNVVAVERESSIRFLDDLHHLEQIFEKGAHALGGALQFLCNETRDYELKRLPSHLLEERIACTMENIVLGAAKH